MIGRIFELSGILIIVGIAVAGFLIPLVVRLADGKSRLMRATEAAILALLAGVAARAFVALLLGLASSSAGVGYAVGWGFFVIPGVVDTVVGTIGAISGGHFLNAIVLSTQGNLLVLASIVGAVTGMTGGMYQIYDWSGLGWIALPLDVTWALAGNTVGCLIHLVNLIWRAHSDETRDNAHRYAMGFGLRYDPPYAFTQGAVMSNLRDKKGDPLYRHEKTHVWQNRAFGPLYTLTYAGWCVVWLVPAMIVGVVIMGIRGIFAGPNNWCYFNCPWEAWAYAVQGSDRTDINGQQPDDLKMIWPAKYVVAWSVPFFLVATAISVLVVYSVWG